jgi:hypothetical protein
MASALCLAGLLGACTPAQTTGLVVRKVNAGEALVRNDDGLSPGDIVHMWRYGCSSQRVGHCGYHRTGDGVVAWVLLDSPSYAVVQFEPGNRVARGDRASKDSPMSYWHPPDGP